MKNLQTDYLFNALDPVKRKEVIKEICRKIQPLEFDSIAFSGMSGSLIVPSVADKCRKPITLVRKDKEVVHHHSFCDVEGLVKDGMKYVVIDDLIAAGNTMKGIYSKINKVCKNSVCIGVLLYAHRVYEQDLMKQTLKEIFHVDDLYFFCEDFRDAC